MVMDATSAAETRERITKWIEETRQIFGLLPELLSADHQAGGRVRAAPKEAERLHKDVQEPRREKQHPRPAKGEIARGTAQSPTNLGRTPRGSPFTRAPSADR